MYSTQPETDGAQLLACTRMFLGSKNDALFIIDRRPGSNDHPNHDAPTEPIAQVYGENAARRLVAALNACLGMSIADIEAMAAKDCAVMSLEALCTARGKLLGEMLNMAIVGDAQENEDWAAIMQDAEALAKRQVTVNRGLERRIAIVGAVTTIETLAHMYQGPNGVEYPIWDIAMLALTVDEPERQRQLRAIAAASKFLDSLGLIERPIDGQPTLVRFTEASELWTTEEPS